MRLCSKNTGSVLLEFILGFTIFFFTFGACVGVLYLSWSHLRCHHLLFEELHKVSRMGEASESFFLPIQKKGKALLFFEESESSWEGRAQCGWIQKNMKILKLHAMDI